MTMHLLPPMYTTTGKKKGKQKFASAEAKAKAEHLAREWRDREREWAKLAPKFSSRPATKSTGTGTLKSGPKIPPGRETVRIESLDTGWVTCAKVKDNEYTGDKCLGISVLHKSNGVPVFSQEEVVEISKMRRG